MGNFNRGGGDRHSDRRGGFERRDGNRSGFGGGREGRPEMHEAVCADCGNTCEIPFRPTGDRPVYCSNCFKNHGKESVERSHDRGRGSDRPRFGDDKRMFSGVCDECGARCEVPFRPTNGKPLYCSDCFGKNGNTKSGGDRGGRNEGSSKDQLASIHTKLDKIMKALNIVSEVKTEKPVEVVKVESKKEDKKNKKSKSETEIVAVEKPKKNDKKVSTFASAVVKTMADKKASVDKEKKVKTKKSK